MRARHPSGIFKVDPGRFPGLPAIAGYGWLAGACVALWSTWQPGRGALAAAAGVALLAALLRRPAVACLLAGFVVTGLVAQERVAARWPPERSGERLLVAGVIDSLPARRGDAVEFDFEGRVVAPVGAARPLRVRVTWRAPQTLPRAAERWQLVLRLQPPRAPLNPGSPDRERFLFRDGIDALGTVVPSALGRRESGPAPGWNSLRETITERIRENVTDRDAAALIAGLAVGATADMTRDQWRVFGATGTVHLVAISGLHVTMFAWLATGAARRAWRVGRLGRVVEREPFAATLGLAAATGYALLAGFSVPTQRTLLMLAAWWLARLAGRPQGGVEVIGLALLAVLLLDPLAPLAAGFWLSFAAIAVLIASDGLEPSPAGPRGATARAGGLVAALGRWPVRAWRALLALTVTQWRVTVALAPATLLLFGAVPVAGLVANLAAIPFFSVLLVPLILASLAAASFSPALGAAGWQVAERLYLGAWPVLEALADLPGAVWNVEPALAWLPAAVLALPLALLPGPGLLRATCLAALLPLLFPARLAMLPGEFAALLLDTGDGVALLVLTRSRALVYDTGDVYGSDGARARNVVLPALRVFGHREIDLVVQSRATGFRVAGVATLLAGAPVEEVRSGGRWTAAPRPVAGCDRATGWFWDGVEVRLFPGWDSEAGEGPGAPPEGGASCVLRVAAHGGRGPALLVPAQVDRSEATRLAARASRERLRAEVVVAPRRGAPAAAPPSFVAAVGARDVLVASREMTDSRRRLVARAWQLPDARVLGTARDGALRVAPRGDSAAIEIVRLVDRQPRWIWRVPRE